MKLSYKQNIYGQYLLKRLGFINSEYIEYYLSLSEKFHKKFIKVEKTEKSPNGYLRKYWELKETNSGCIEEFLKEIEIKKNLGSIKLKDENKSLLISATDIANYNFCPVSYSITKSFEIEYPNSNEDMVIGIDLHEKLQLIKKGVIGTADHYYYQNDKKTDEKIKKIRNCELIFAGHTDKKKYFINESLNFIGQPDYIFKDTNNKFFVVEEKFKYFNNEELTNNNTYFTNHKLQVQSYINYIQEFELEYGVLIYWFYNIKNDYINIHDVSIKVIKKSEDIKLLEETKNEIKKLTTNKTIDFNININPTKCISCKVNKYCVHKASELKKLTYPYNRYFMKLKKIEFPHELSNEN